MALHCKHDIHCISALIVPFKFQNFSDESILGLGGGGPNHRLAVPANQTVIYQDPSGLDPAASHQLQRASITSGDSSRVIPAAAALSCGSRRVSSFGGIPPRQGSPLLAELSEQTPTATVVTRCAHLKRLILLYNKTAPGVGKGWPGEPRPTIFQNYINVCVFNKHAV